MPAQQELKAGYHALSKYLLIGKIAQGGMAEVYLAYKDYGQPEQELIVLKRIQPELRDNEQYIGMFKNEAEIASLLKHPNVISIYEVGQDNEEWFMAMEYLNGRDMLQLGRACRKRKKAVPFEVTARILAETCKALDHAHHVQDQTGTGLNLVHRDMSPENIFLTFDGDVKILDFGIAKSDKSTDLTQAGQVKGKLGYVAPEAIKGKKVDHRGDIYAIGATLYLFLTGRPAVQGSNPLEIFENALKKPVNPRELNPHIPVELESICLKAMEVKPEDRYQNASEMTDALENFLATRTLQLDRKQRQKFMAMLFPPDKETSRVKVQKMLDDFEMHSDAYVAASQSIEPEEDLAGQSLAQTHNAQQFSNMKTDLADLPYADSQSGPPTDIPNTGSIELSTLVAQPQRTFKPMSFLLGLAIGTGIMALTHFALSGM